MRPEEKFKAIQDAFTQHAVPIPVGSLIAPTASVLAREAGLVPTTLSNPDQLGNGYKEKLATVTGLTIIGSGLVLAPSDALIERPNPRPLSLDTMSPEQLVRHIAKASKLLSFYFQERRY